MTYRKKIEKLKEEVKNKDELIKKLNNQIIQDNTEIHKYIHIINENNKTIFFMRQVIDRYFHEVQKLNEIIKNYKKQNCQYKRTTTKATRKNKNKPESPIINYSSYDELKKENKKC